MKMLFVLLGSAFLCISSAQFIPPLPSYQPAAPNPYYQLLRFGNPLYSSYLHFSQTVPPYSHYQPFDQNLIDNYLLKSYIRQPYSMPPFTVLEEVPFIIQSKFTVVPMIIASGENMNVLTQGKIIEISKINPTVTLKTTANQLVQVTPAVKITLEKPMFASAVKSNIMFPSVVEINHEGVRIPIKVGAVIVPVPKETVVSEESPIIIRVVFAISTTPLSLDYTNYDTNVIINGDNQAVSVDSDPIAHLPPRNITILDFPEKEADPSLQISEDDESLVNRNPPIGLIPAGIVQSTQPLATVQEFHNSKESPLLNQLREEAIRQRQSQLQNP